MKKYNELDETKAKEIQKQIAEHFDISANKASAALQMVNPDIYGPKEHYNIVDNTDLEQLEVSIRFL